MRPGLDYSLARYYASSQGRFISVDPIAGQTNNRQSLNRYVYVLNNPLRLVDPLGTESVDPWDRLTRTQQLALVNQIEQQWIVYGKNKRLETWAEAFNRMISAGATEQQVTERIMTIQNFIAAAGGYNLSDQWRAIKTIDRVGTNSVEVTVSDNKKFLDALESEGYAIKSRSWTASLKEWIAGTSKDHPGDSARSKTGSAYEIQFHYGQDHINDSSYGEGRALMWAFHFDNGSSNTGRLSEDYTGGKLHSRNPILTPDMGRADLIKRSMVPKTSQCRVCGSN